MPWLGVSVFLFVRQQRAILWLLTVGGFVCVTRTLPAAFLHHAAQACHGFVGGGQDSLWFPTS